MLLSIDIGLINTGYALFKNKKYLFSDTLVIKDKTNNFQEIYWFFNSLIKVNQIDTIVYEEPQSFINRKIASSLLKISGIYEALAIELDCECYCYNPMTVKKIITGSGKSNKKEIELSIVKKLEEENNKLSPKQTHHSIDAIAVGYTHFLSSNSTY